MGWLNESNTKILPILIIGFLLNFTIYVKAIPVILTINKEIGGSETDPSSEAIFVLGTLFVIRSVVKFCFLNYGGRLSDYTGRKPVLLLTVLPSILADLLFLYSPITAALVFIVGALIGIFALAIPVMRAWIADLVLPSEALQAQGSYRGISIGLAAGIGLPVGAVVGVAIGHPYYAYAISLFAGLLAALIIIFCRRDDLITGGNDAISVPTSGDIAAETTIADAASFAGAPSLPSTTAPSVVARRRSLPPAWLPFLLAYNPLRGFHVVVELPSPAPQLFLCYLLTNAATESFIHTLVTYLLKGADFSPSLALIGVAVTGFSYALLTERIIRRTGDLRASSFGMSVNIVINLMVAACSLFAPAIAPATWLFLILLPLDSSHAALNGLITRLFPITRKGEVQGVLEQLTTLSVLLGYPGTLLFSYFVSSHTHYYWPGPQFALAAFYSGLSLSVYCYNVIFNKPVLAILAPPDARTNAAEPTHAPAMEIANTSDDGC